MIFISNQNLSTKFIKKVLIKTSFLKQFFLNIFFNSTAYLYQNITYVFFDEYGVASRMSVILVLTILTFSFQPMPGCFTFADNTEFSEKIKNQLL